MSSVTVDRHGKKKKSTAIKRAFGDVVFDVINVTLICIMLVIFVYPIWYTIAVSFAEPAEAAAGTVYFWPKKTTIDAYAKVFETKSIWISYANTALYTVAHTLYVLALTIPSAYALSKKQLPGRVAITYYFFVTMFLSGGLIPSYMLNKSLGLVNSRWIMILGMGVSYSNLVITRSYFQTSIPNEVYESAYIDGATEFQTFIKIAMPLAGAIIAVQTLYAATGTWNSWYGAFIYITDQNKWPLQLRLREILIQGQTQSLDFQLMTTEEQEEIQRQAFMVYTMKYAIIFIASAPMIAMYPFVQKHFVKGVMIGSVKG